MLNKLINFLKNRSLVFKLSVSILLSVFIGSLLLSIFISNYSKPLLKEQVISSAYKALASVNHNLAQGADITEQSLVNTVKILSLKKSSNEQELVLLARAAHEAILEQYGNFYEFFIFIPSKDKNHKGHLYNSYLKNGKVEIKSWEEHEYVKNREWYNAAINSGKIHWTEPYDSIDPDRNVLLSTTVSVPFKFKGSSTWDGVIGASGNLSAMQDYLKSLSFESNGKYLLTSAKGLYIIHPDKKIELKKTITELAKEIKSEQLKYAYEHAKSGKIGFTTIPKSSVYKGEAVFVYAPVPKVNWSSYLVYSSDNFYKPIKHFQIILISITLFGVFLLILLINWICKFTTNPIVELSHVAEKYGRGEFDAELPTVKSNDEVGILTLAFYNMKDNLLNLLKIQKENAASEQKRASELEIATKIQDSVLPHNFPKNPYFNIFASMTPAKEVGGDFYDFFQSSENRFAFLIADVSGKGIPASLFMMNAKSLLKNNLLSGNSLQTAINKTNNELCETNTQGLFLTAFIALVDIQTGSVEFANAGHNPPLLRHKNGMYEFFKLEPNLPLGAIGKFDYQTYKTNFEENDIIFLYTDGVTEAFNDKGEMYGETRLIEFLNKNKNEGDVKELIIKMKSELKEFANSSEQSDDITMIAFNYKAKSPNRINT
ncbi:MAG: SpoIIE family protein phosphatase [Candidatus Gastranaerophilales bacterium]|nr:SpoIIE family protein phosphatase [Candidatus Gastranaerophilales bacterium]